MSQLLPSIKSLILDQLHGILFANRNQLLHYEAATQTLIPYPWPLNEEGQPIDQSELEEYRSSHAFAYPGCLCPAIANSEVQTESVLLVVSIGDDSPGIEHQATCAKGVCGYTVKLFFRPGDPVFLFPRKVLPQVQCAPRILVPHGLEILADVASHRVIASRAVEKAEYHRLLEVIPLFPLPTVGPNVPSLASMIYRLHCAHRPGLTSEEFRNNFICCECGIVSTRRKHKLHQCDYVSRSAAHQEDMSASSDSEVLNMLYRLDMTGPEMTLRIFEQIMARCLCGLVMTKLRFLVHECRGRY